MNSTSSMPATLGKYQIRGVLGRGAMGTVYDGLDPHIGRRVALKTVRLLDNDDPEMQEGLARFKNEAQAAGRLSHPNIVAVYDYGELEETAFIVMEFVEGQSLKQRLDVKERFAIPETIRIMEQVLAGLQYSHDKGVIHRDIKPANVMMTADGQVKLADFGIARIESSVMTQAGTMLGTPAYMSPEQLMAQAVDARTDIYSAGVLLYQLLTGERPFDGGLTAIIHKALNTSAPRPSEISVTAPPGLDVVVARAMAKGPEDRYPSAAAFAAALREVPRRPDIGLGDAGLALDDESTMVVPAARLATDPQISARPAPRPEPRPMSTPVARKERPNPALLGGIGIVVLGLAGGSAWLALREPTSKPPEQPVAAAQPAAPVTPPPPPAPLEEPQQAAVPPAPIAPPAETTNVAAAAPPLNIAAMRSALTNLTVSARCAVPRFVISDTGVVSVSGLVGAGDPEAALRDAVQTSVGSAPLNWGAQSISGSYCGVLDLVRSVAQPGSPSLGLALKDDATRLKTHDFILPIVTMPEFPAYLVVDYFSHDGSVAHLFPVRGVLNPAFGGNATVRLGTSARDRVEVGPPYGTDVIVATASSAPLFPPGVIREDETEKTYLPVLKAAIEAVEERDGKVTGRALLLDTVER